MWHFAFYKYIIWHVKLLLFAQVSYTRDSRRNRSSHQMCSMKKGVLKNFAKFIGKHLCQSLFFNKVAGGACNFIKKENLARVFSCKFCEISKNTLFTEYLWTTAYRERIFCNNSLQKGFLHRSSLTFYLVCHRYVLVFNSLKQIPPSYWLLLLTKSHFCW